MRAHEPEAQAGGTGSLARHSARAWRLACYLLSTPNPQHPIPAKPRRAGFTLVELLITVSVIAIMASMILFALFAAQETARVQKTKAFIAKLDAIIKAKYESYKTRRVPINIPPPPESDRPHGNTAMQLPRLEGLRDLMRMELPDRWSDVTDGPTVVYRLSGTDRDNVSSTAIDKSNRFFQKYSSTPRPPSPEYGGAECLYMIIMAAQAEEADDRSAIKPDQIGDFDNDGVPEFLDAWGQPIRFLRWAPGFVSELQVVATGTVNGSVNAPDSHTMTFPATGRSLAKTAGSYVGGAIVGKKTGSEEFDTSVMGFIGNYSYAAGTATFTSTTPTYTGQRPFRGMGGPTGTQEFYVMAPDPFDPRHVYPLYSVSMGNTAPNPDTSIPTFALYPLIFSAGPDKGYGVAVDFSGGLQYINQRCCPFPIDGNGRMIGTQMQLSVESSDRMWLDNIHNHMITAR